MLFSTVTTVVLKTETLQPKTGLGSCTPILSFSGSSGCVRVSSQELKAPVEARFEHQSYESFQTVHILSNTGHHRSALCESPEANTGLFTSVKLNLQPFSDLTLCDRRPLLLHQKSS